MSTSPETAPPVPPTAPDGRKDAAALYRLIAGAEPDAEHYIPLAGQAELHGKFSPELLRRVDAALSAPATAAARPIGMQIALYLFLLCAIPAAVIAVPRIAAWAAAPAPHPVTPAAPHAPAEGEQATAEPQEQPNDLLPDEQPQETPAAKAPASLTRKIKRQVVRRKAAVAKKKTVPTKKKAAPAKKKVAPAKKKAAEAKKNKSSVQKNRTATKKKATPPQTKKKAANHKVRASAPKRTQEAPLLSPEEQMQRLWQPGPGATYNMPRGMRPARRVRVPAYYMY